MKLSPKRATPIMGAWSINSEFRLHGLDDSDRALVVWEGLSVDTDKFDHISISIKDLPSSLDATLVWRTDASDVPGSLALPRSIGARLTVPLRASEHWKGTVSLLGIAIAHAYDVPLARRPELQATIGTPSLQDSSWRTAVQAQLTAWTSPRLVSGSTINTIGRPAILGTIAPLYLGYLAALLVLVFGIVVVLRGGGRIASLWFFAVSGLLFAQLIAVIPQWRDLLANVADARETYGDATDPLDQVPAAYLYQVAVEVRARVPNREARIFLASPSQFVRERTNYFLAPYNAAPLFDGRYRSTRHDPPASKGEYVLVFADAELDWNPGAGALSSRWHEYEAMPVWGNEYATLFRVGRVVK